MNHRHEELDDDERKRVIPDGGRIRVSMMVMDSVQKQVASVDERVQHSIEGNKATLAKMKADADRAQAFADHYTAQREAEADNSAYGKLCARLEREYLGAAA